MGGDFHKYLHSLIRNLLKIKFDKNVHVKLHRNQLNPYNMANYE